MTCVAVSTSLLQDKSLLHDKRIGHKNKKAETDFPDSALYEITKHGYFLDGQRLLTKFSTASLVISCVPKVKVALVPSSVSAFPSQKRSPNLLTATNCT